MTIRIIIRKMNSSDMLSYTASVSDSVSDSDVACGNGNNYMILATVRALVDSPQNMGADIEFEGFESRVNENNIHALVTGRARNAKATA